MRHSAAMAPRTPAAAVLALLLAAPARAEPPTPAGGPPRAAEAPMTLAARARYDRGVELSAAERFGEAGREFQAAYDIEPRRESLFAWAQVVRLAGDCPAAVALYRRFLEVAAAPEEIEAATLGIRRCERAADRPPPAVPAAPAVAAEDPRATRRRRLVTATFLAGGAVFLGGGGALFFAATAEESAAATALRYDGYHSTLQRARIMQVGAVGLTVAGVSLVAAGVLRLVVGATSAPATDLTLWRSPAGAGVGWGGVF